MDEIQRAKERFAQAVEDGRKIEVFTSMPEYQWYIDKVVNPTMEEYTNRVLSGELESDKEDWIMRGMIMGMRLMVGTPESFKKSAKDAKKKAKDLAKYERMEDDF